MNITGRKPQLHKQSSVPTTIAATTLQRQIGVIIRRAFKDKEHFIVERGGLPVIAILPIDHYQALLEKPPKRDNPHTGIIYRPRPRR